MLESSRNEEEETDHDIVVEGIAAGAVGRKGAIVDGGRLLEVRTHSPPSSTLQAALTVVVLTPQSSAGGCGDGAAGVSINSKSSDDSECDFAMMFAGVRRGKRGE